MSKYMQHDSKPNATQMRDAHKTSANTALIYTTQPNKTQTTNLAIKADGKTKLRMPPIPKLTTTYKDPSCTTPIELDRPRAI